MPWGLLQSQAAKLRAETGHLFGIVFFANSQLCPGKYTYTYIYIHMYISIYVCVFVYSYVIRVWDVHIPTDVCSKDIATDLHCLGAPATPDPRSRRRPGRQPGDGKPQANGLAFFFFCGPADEKWNDP